MLSEIFVQIRSFFWGYARKEIYLFFLNISVPYVSCLLAATRRPASADRTARRQFQATGQPVSRTQASDAMTSWLLRYETKCVRVGPFAFRYQGHAATPCQYIDTAWHMKLCSRLFVLHCRNCPKDDKFRYFIPILRK